MKIMLMTAITLMVLRSRQDIQRLVWVIVISLGFYGVKGGLFTLVHGGTDRVWGPEGTFIADNNAIALALIITLPLMRYLQQTSARRWLRTLMTAAMVLTALAVLGSYSRGALLAIAAMLIYMWGKGHHKVLGAALLILMVPLVLLLMPESWTARMDTISTYQEDSSALGRLNAWQMAINLGLHRLLGGGFEVSGPLAFAMYAPDPQDVHAAHSIYFQALGEHGAIGLALYLMLGVATWRSAAWIKRHGANDPEWQWAAHLAAMIQASLVGFAVGGAFLSLLYFDVPYFLMAVVVTTRLLMARAQAASVLPAQPPPAPI
jgi:probable O-glycosylation ligase (exosortase A-associated)